MRFRTISSILVIVMLFSMNSPVFASDSQVPLSADYNLQLSNNEGELLQEKNVSRSRELPTNYHNLAEDDYDVDLQLVGRDRLYTNVYYHPNGNGKIYVDYDVEANEETTNLYIGLYDLTEDARTVEHTPIEVSTTGKTGTMYFYNLTPSHSYAIYFRAHPSALNGSAIIRH